MIYSVPVDTLSSPGKQMQVTQRLVVPAVLSILVFASMGVAVGMGITSSHNGPQASGGGGCPSSNAIGNFVSSSLVGASVAMNGSTWTYLFSSFVNLNPSSGVPGLIEYCVYPNGTLPSSPTVAATGADGSSFVVLTGTHQGFFGFGRSHGDPSNLPLDGTQNIVMGAANWSTAPPSTETILLHINDATECQTLYGGTSNTCFVLPGTAPVVLCGGNPACKSAVVAEANATNAWVVPMNTQLHIAYTFTLVNQPGSGHDMQFLFPTGTGNNLTGVRDFFNCTQVPDPSGSPGSSGSFANYQGTGLTIALRFFSITGCSNLVLRATASNATIVLQPGQSITFTVDTITGTTGFTSAGWHCLNMGVAVTWYQSNDGMLHHYHSPDVDVWAQ